MTGLLRKWSLGGILVAVFIGLVFQGCGQRGDTRVIKLGHALAPSHPVHQAMEYMAKRVSEKSEDSIRIDIYPSEQLGSEREMLELLQVGSLGMTKTSTSPLEAFAPIFKVFGMPYLFRSDAHRFKVLEGPIGEQLLRAPMDDRLLGLCYYDAGSRSFYTVDQPIRKPEDLKGLKIRTMNSTTAIQMVRALGGSPTPISWGELYSALQQGIVDAAENNPPSFHLSHHYEVCEYYSLDKHTSIPDILLISMEVWEDLTKEEQRIIKESAMESVQRQKKLWAEATEEAMKRVQEAGVEIIRPDMEPFREKVQGMYEEYEEQFPKVYDVVQEIRNVEVE